jgi:hypothetical protein
MSDCRVPVNRKIGPYNLARMLFNVLALVSALFLLYFLYSYDYVRLDSLTLDYPIFLLSIVVLFIPLLIGTMTWSISLSAHGMSVPFRAAVSSHGLSIFAKYVPGKVWTILGRAAYVNSMGPSFADASFVSAKLQIANIIVGLMFGLAPAIFLEGAEKFRLAILLLLVAMTLSLVSERIQRAAAAFVSRTSRQNVELPIAEGSLMLTVVVLLMIQWLAYSLSYFLFAKSLYPGVTILAAFAFPLAMNFGLLAIFAPGGIGIREGVMAGYLALVGVPLSTATTMSIASRLWFLVGEVFIFAAGWVAQRWRSPR